MLVISTHKDSEGYYIKLELENYYRRRDRAVVAEQELTTHNPIELEKNPLFFENMIDYIVRGISLQIDGINDDEPYPCQILYPFFRNKKDVLRKDREDYTYKKEREKCEEIQITKASIQDTDFQKKLAKMICTYLPLGPFPHALDETAPKAIRDLDMLPPLFYGGWNNDV